MSYWLVEKLQKKAVPVSQACRVLQVSQSGYYAARMRSRRAPVACTTSVQLKAAFAASGRAYGSRRLYAALRQQGLSLGRHRVRTLMQANGLRLHLEAQVRAHHGQPARLGRLAQRAGAPVRAGPA